MKAYVDLHIHSCLSPCGDELMTPNNIVHMAKLKGLNMIAVSDHNSARNLPAVKKVADAAGLALLPAMELTTREEVHLLSYFRTVDAACAFSNAVYPFLADIRNNPGFFGEQQVMNENDEVIAEEEKLLLGALDIPIEELAERICAAGGLPVPAHINREDNGLFAMLGFMPPGLKAAALEVSKAMPCPPVPKGYAILHSSDAHRLEDIYERVEAIDLPEISPDGFFQWLAG